jgi:glycerol uptake facilitator-like aquaporin
MSGRMISAFVRSSIVTMRVFWRITKQLFHETTGALFAVFAGYGGYIVWKEWKQGPSIWLMAVGAVYALMMGAFAFGSFRRAKRVR